MPALHSQTSSATCFMLSLYGTDIIDTIIFPRRMVKSLRLVMPYCDKDIG